MGKNRVPRYKHKEMVIVINQTVTSFDALKKVYAGNFSKALYNELKYKIKLMLLVR